MLDTAPDTIESFVPKFLKWHDLESFQNVLRSRSKWEPMKEIKEVSYTWKPKIHGTNAAIRITKDGVFAQSRTQIITPQDDNYGFAAWLETVKPHFSDLAKACKEDGNEYTFFGEWCGPGINKGTSINKIPEKIFAIFSAALFIFGEFRWVYDPLAILLLLCNTVKKISIPNVYIIPNMTYNPLVVKFEDSVSMNDFLYTVNSTIDKISENDDWIEKTFGVKGPGEGAVFYPWRLDALHDDNIYKQFIFKAKGEEFRVNHHKTAAQVDPEVIKSQLEFVEYAVTEARLNQAMSVLFQNETPTKEKTGDFLKWVCSDIFKECQNEIQDSGLDWKKLSGPVAQKARGWFMKKC